jgi:hypothetical protein
VAGAPAGARSGLPGHDLPGDGGWAAPAVVPFAAPPWERVLPSAEQVIDLRPAQPAVAAQPHAPRLDDDSPWSGLIETAEFAGPVERAHA